MCEKLEIKTTRQIYEKVWNILISSNVDRLDKITQKRWVSVESLKRWINYQLKCVELDVDFSPSIATAVTVVMFFIFCVVFFIVFPALFYLETQNWIIAAIPAILFGAWILGVILQDYFGNTKEKESES